MRMDATEGKSLFRQLRAVRAAMRDSEHHSGHDSGLDAVADDCENALKSAAADFAQSRAAARWADAYRVIRIDGRRRMRRTRRNISTQSCNSRMRWMRLLEPLIKATIAHWEGGLVNTKALATFLHASDGADAGQGDNVVEDVIRGTIQTLRPGHDALPHRRPNGSGFSEGHTIATNDPFHDYRNYLYEILRRPGEENVFRTAGKPDSRFSDCH